MSRLRDQLMAEFKIADADHAAIDKQDMFGIEAASKEKLNGIRKELVQIAIDLPKLNRKIEVVTASAMKSAGLNRLFTAASDATSAGVDVISNDLQKWRADEQMLDASLAATCDAAGSVTYGECTFYVERLKKLRAKIAEKEREAAKEVSSQDRVASNISKQADLEAAKAKQQQSPLDALTQERDELLSRRMVLNDHLERLPGVLESLQHWHSVSRGEAENTGLASVIRNRETAEADLKLARQSLSDLIKTQKKRAKTFQSRFDSIVRKTINKQFRGAIDIREDGINFRITREDSLAGEAYETLAVLLADLSLLLASVSPKVNHPGFLLHDSPREADLNVRIYERLLQVASDEMAATETDEPPFQ